MAIGKIYPCILSGGSGTRLWPVSRTHAPKQLQPLISDNSLIVETALRTPKSDRFAAPIIISNASYAETIATQLQRAGSPASHIITEPFGRNTAPAAAAAAELVAQIDPDGIVLLLAADHFIQDHDIYRGAILRAAGAASAGHIVTFGITPSHPETGFGYIKYKTELMDGVFKVDKFVEKPDLETAKAYLAAKTYAWNSGMFVFKPSTFLSELKNFNTEIAAHAIAALKHATTEMIGATKIHHLGRDDFALCPSDSIDYAVMEHTSKAAMVRGDFRWSDVGSWAALYEIGAKDKDGNVTHGDVITHDTTGSLISSQSRLVSVAGVQDLIITETPDAVMICPKDASQMVKNLHGQLAEAGRIEAKSQVIGSSVLHHHSRDDLRHWYKTWLLEEALPHWSGIALDPKTGGSYEACDYSGAPLTDLKVRLRVHARQVFAFAFAYEKLGWEEGKAALEKPLAHLLKTGRKADDGFGHVYNADGSWDNDNSDTYDHAFVLMALAWAYKVTGREELKTIADETLHYLQTALKHPTRGFQEGLPPSSIRRANPHMHLLEAALAWMELHGSKPFSDIADDIVSMFKHIFCEDGLLREYFHDDLSVITDSPEHGLIEPGHLYEWAYLLKTYKTLSGKPAPETAALTAFADKYGWNSQARLIMDFCHVDGRPVDNASYRLWTQTEYVRFNLRYAAGHDVDRALQHLAVIKNSYLYGDDLAPGIWRDKLNAAGGDISPNSPASTFYHLIGMIDAI